MKSSSFKTVLALCLLCLTTGANADHRDRRGFDSGDLWRLGNGHDRYGIYHRVYGEWGRVPGSATAVGDGWVIGTDRRGGGYGIYRWNGRDWTRVPGGAVSIGGTYEQPWVINNRGEKFFWNGYDWSETRGRGRHASNDHDHHANSALDHLDAHQRDSRRR